MIERDPNSSFYCLPAIILWGGESFLKRRIQRRPSVSKGQRRYMVAPFSRALRGFKLASLCTTNKTEASPFEPLRGIKFFWGNRSIKECHSLEMQHQIELWSAETFFEGWWSTCWIARPKLDCLPDGSSFLPIWKLAIDEIALDRASIGYKW